MSISIFQLFSIGIGPSSSHMIGPMRAAKRFLNSIESESLYQVTRVAVTLYGSLAFTGEGHGTNKAVLMGWEGEDPETVDPDSIPQRVHVIQTEGYLRLLGQHGVKFNMADDVICNKQERLPHYSNGMRYVAFHADRLMKQEDYYSVGGGFVVTEEEMAQSEPPASVQVPYPFSTAAEWMAHARQQACSPACIIMENEKAYRTEAEIKQTIFHIVEVMNACIDKGIRTDGVLGGGLRVQRRAPGLYRNVLRYGEAGPDHPQPMNWLNVYALAVNEENAAGGRVVTAPTNGAAGIIPAVLRYYQCFCRDTAKQGVIDFMLTAGAIGLLYKERASIAGAEMGCQGEVGVACSMAAGGLAAALGGTALQIENAAEIAMEHNLGLTCDPVAGLVQIPCIERNAMGAVKAVNAARLALAETGEHRKVTLDMAINTMREIGNNMQTIYKETSQGGLAVNVPEC